MSDKQVGSFLEPRPPFVNSWNKRFIIRNMNKNTEEVKKNLVYHMGEEEEPDDTIKVFLRLKPCLDKKESVLEVLDSRTLLAKVPQSVIDKKKISKHDSCKYTFSHIFGPTVSQKELFSTCVENSVDEFLTGKNCLLFTYGTTNAGKTYTVQGNADQPGIIPRIIATIFKSIENKQNKDSKFCPLTTTSAVELNQRCLDEQVDLKNKIIYWNPEKVQNDSGHSVKSKHTRTTFDSIGDSSYREMQSKLDSEIVEKCFSEENVRFSVWVSFAEIYNEGIYDLLQPPNDKGKRQQLKLAQDTFKNNFIKGLNHINVNTAEEAHRVLRYGKHNICFASTGMNATSSRSHCIFSIKLSKFPDLHDSENMQISSFSICDLAGAERQKNTLNVGDRLKESQNINCSLHILSRCFRIIRENQNKVDKQRIPFRDSKLTHLFQNALSGKESITMIINVNPCIEIYEETQHVLKSSAIARAIVFVPRPKPKSQPVRLSRFSNIINQHKRETLIPWESSLKTHDEVAEPDTKPTSSQNQEDLEYYLSFIEALQSKLKEEREKSKKLKQLNLTLETDLRKELTTDFQQMMEFLKDHYTEMNLRSEKCHEEREKEKISNLTRRHEEEINKLKQKLSYLNASNELSAIQSDDAYENQGLRNKIETLENEIEDLNDVINLAEEEKTKLAEKVSNLNKQCIDANFENKKLKKELEAARSDVLELLELDQDKQADKITENEDLQEEIKDLENQVQGLTQLVNITKEEKTELVQKMSYLNIQCSAVITENEQLKKALEASKSENNELLMLELDGLRKEMAEKIKTRDELLEDARADLEFEIKEKSALEEFVTNLEKELAGTVQKLEDMEVELKSQNDILNLKNNLIDELESKLQEETDKCKVYDGLKSTIEEELNELKTRSHQQEETLAMIEINRKDLSDQVEAKNEIIKQLESKIQEETDKNKVYDGLKSSIEEELNELKTRCHQQEETLAKVEINQKDLSNQVEAKNEIIKKLESKIQVMSEENDTLQAENSKILNKKCENCEKGRLVYEEQLSKRNKEINVLELNIKKMLKDWAIKEKEVKDKTEETNILQKELKVAMQAVKTEKELAKQVIQKSTVTDQELESLRSKLIAYEDTAIIMKSYSEEVEKKNSELSMLRQLTQEQNIINQQLEQELHTFQSNQKTICARYEDQLRKCKEEIEREKREATSLSNTLYKSTPTPKKDLQAENEKLKQELEAEKLSKSSLLQEVSLLKSINTSSKENEDPIKRPKAKSKRIVTKASERPCKSTSNLEVEHSDCDDVFVPKSERRINSTLQVSSRKTRGQRLKESIHPLLPDIYVTQVDNLEPTEKKGKTRRRLYDPSQETDAVFDDNFEVGDYVRQESPGSAIKHTLRSRKRIGKP